MPTLIGLVCPGSHDLNCSNRPVRTRMPGGVGGERPGKLTAPIPIAVAVTCAWGQVRAKATLTRPIHPVGASLLALSRWSWVRSSIPPLRASKLAPTGARRPVRMKAGLARRVPPAMDRLPQASCICCWREQCCYLRAPSLLAPTVMLVGRGSNDAAKSSNGSIAASNVSTPR